MATRIHPSHEPDNDPSDAASSEGSPAASNGQFPLSSRQSTVQPRPIILAPASAIGPGPLQPSTPTIYNGPASGLAFIPPRPKPGRKPASDEPENKRKAQNRAAQRAFRERKLQGQHQLEYENKDLRVVNDSLAKEIQQYRDSASAGKRRIEELESELAECVRREGELRDQNERNASTLSTIEQHAREAEANAKRLYEDNSNLRDEVAALRRKLSQAVTGTASAGTDNYHLSNGIETASEAHIAPKVVNGCGDCEENGDCPCVDSYLDSAATARPTMASHHRHHSSMAIDTLLAPIDANSSASVSSVPDLVSDHSSPEDMEIDFTHAFKPASQNAFTFKSERCGFCEDGGKCICAEIEADAANSLPLPPITSILPPVRKLPGSCLQCQQDPEQKAYCESLARERSTTQAAPDEQPGVKRRRIQLPKIKVPCADAFALYKQYSNSPAPSHEELYRSYIQTNPGSRQGVSRGDKGMNAEDTIPRHFSAYETDIAAVIATLHHHKPGATNGAESRTSVELMGSGSAKT